MQSQELIFIKFTQYVDNFIINKFKKYIKTYIKIHMYMWKVYREKETVEKRGSDKNYWMDNRVATIEYRLKMD